MQMSAAAFASHVHSVSETLRAWPGFARREMGVEPKGRANKARQLGAHHGGRNTALLMPPRVLCPATHLTISPCVLLLLFPGTIVGLADGENVIGPWGRGRQTRGLGRPFRFQHLSPAPAGPRPRCGASQEPWGVMASGCGSAALTMLRGQGLVSRLTIRGQKLVTW